MYGINNRNLGTFITDVQNSYRLAELLPRDAVKVSESGISNPKTVRELRNAGFKGFLIGETFMKTEDPGKALKNFIDRI
jgi:indole-3-glycerol phosphate synthase